MLRTNSLLNEKIGPNLYFTIADLGRVFDIKSGSARVMASRYTKAGVFVRLKKDMYVLASSWTAYGSEQFLRLANIIQVPSYVSFLTALSYHGVTTQVPRNVFDSAAQKRTANYEIKKVIFNYYKLQKQYYFGFSLLDGTNIFIGSKEKALVDTIYLISFGKYRIDLDAINLAGMDRNEIRKIIRVYPDRTQRMVRDLCRI